MSLSQLPPEILIQILDDVGSRFFREDVRRLTVSKSWYRLAHITLVKALQLSRDDIRRLIASDDVEASLFHIEDNTESLDIRLQGYEDWGSLPVSKPNFNDSNQQNIDNYIAPSWTSYLGTSMLRAWTSILHADLTRLVETASAASKLRTLRLHAFHERHPDLFFLPRRDYLSAVTIRDLLTSPVARNLTTLDLDTCGTRLTAHPDGVALHVCPLIGALLPSLRVLRLRMQRICEAVLQTPDSAQWMRLKTVLLCLSLSDEARFASRESVWVAEPCNGPASEWYSDNFAEMIRAATDLVGRMEAPEMFRVLWCGVMVDVLTGNQMIWEKGAAWEADGREI